MDTYFSVPASATVLAPYTARGGPKSVGLELGVRYDLSEDWSAEGIAEYARLKGDAAASPIVQAGSVDEMTLKLLFLRRFTLRF